MNRPRNFALALSLLVSPLALANPPNDMGTAPPLPPPTQPMREKTKRQVRNGEDQHSGDDSKVKNAEKPGKAPGQDVKTTK